MIPGRYMARATGEFQYGESQAGNTLIWVAFEITEGDYTGWTVQWLCVLVNGKDNKNAVTGLQNAGIAMDPATGDLYVAEAKDVELVIEYDEWNGRVELKVKWVNKPGAGGRFKHSELPPEKKAHISHALRGALGALAVPRPGSRQAPQGQRRPAPMPAQRQAPAQAAPAPSAERPPDDDCGYVDEIPF